MALTPKNRRIPISFFRITFQKKIIKIWSKKLTKKKTIGKISENEKNKNRPKKNLVNLMNIPKTITQQNEMINKKRQNK